MWYPRAGTLGGCTAHNALIFVYPSQTDWNQLADLTADASWRAPAMRKYFQRVENCRHRPFERFWQRLAIDPSRHGWSGWLPTEKAVPEEAIADPQVRRIIAESVSEIVTEFGAPSISRLESLGDPNDWRNVDREEVGDRHRPRPRSRGVERDRRALPPGDGRAPGGRGRATDSRCGP